MKLIPSLALTGWLYSSLLWGYCSFRYAIQQQNGEFQPGWGITMPNLAMLAFIISAICFFVYQFKKE